MISNWHFRVKINMFPFLYHGNNLERTFGHSDMYRVYVVVEISPSKGAWMDKSCVPLVEYCACGK